MSEVWRLNTDSLRRLGMALTEDDTLSAVWPKLRETASSLAVSGQDGAAMRTRLFELADAVARQSRNTVALGESLAQITSCYEQAEEEALSYIRAAAPGQKQGEDAWNNDISYGSGAESTAPIPGISEMELPQRCGYDPTSGAYSSDPVNLCTGNLVWQETDASILCGTRLRVRRTYNSQSKETGWFGKGWVSEWEEHLLFHQGQVIGICMGDGRVIPQQAVQGSLEEDDNGYRFFVPGGEVHFFTGDGMLQRIRTAGNEELRLLPGSDGRALLIAYASSTGAILGQIAVTFQETGCISGITSLEDPTIKEENALRLLYRYEEQNNHPVLSGVVRNDRPLRIYAYDDAILLRTIRDGTGELLVENRFDPWARCVQQRFADQTGISYRYTAGENRTDVTERTGDTRYCEYDSRGRKLDDARSERRTLYTYDAAGRIRTVTYEGIGTIRCRRTSDTALQQVLFQPIQGRNTQKKGTAKNEISLTVDQREKKRILTLHASSKETRFYLNASGALQKVSYPSGKSYRLTYDQEGMLSSIAQNGEILCDYQRTGEGVLRGIEEKTCGRTGYTYDDRGRLHVLTDRFGKQFRFSYALSDVAQTSLLTEMQISEGRAEDDSENASVFYQYDHKDRLTGIVCQDHFGMLLSREFKRDASGRMVTICLDGVREERKIHQAEREVIQSFPGQKTGDCDRITADGNQPGNESGSGTKQIRHVFFAQGTVERRDAYDETGVDTMIASYDHTNLITSLTGREGTYIWKRDVLGRTLQELRPDGVKIRRGFASCGKIAFQRIQLPGEEGMRETVWIYDRRANPVSITDLGKKVFDTYAEHKLMKRTFPNGICSLFLYDRQGNILRVDHQRREQCILTIAYEYDTFQRIVTRRMEISPGLLKRSDMQAGKKPVVITFRYTYDKGRTLSMESITTETPDKSFKTIINDTYDAAGNRRQRSITSEDGSCQRIRYDYDHDSRLLRVIAEGCEDKRYSYDDMGNVHLISKNNDQDIVLKYSPLGELREIQKTKKADGISESCDHRSYDPFGCLHSCEKGQDIIQNIYDTNQYPPRLTGRTYCGRRCWYLWDKLPVLMHTEEETYCYLTDGMGRLVAVTDSQGEVAEWFFQDAFGNTLPRLQELSGYTDPTRMPGWKILQPFTYTGMERDPYDDWYHTHFREYDPALGRFLSPDRCDALSKLPYLWNRYSFCFSDPVNLRDPDGRWPKLPSLADIGQGLISAGEWFADGATTIINTICGANQTIYQIDENGVTYSVTEHTGGSVFVSNYDQYGNYIGWAINASVKIPFTDISLKTSLSGTDLNPFTWGIKQSIKFAVGDGEVSSYTQYALALGQSGISWQAESGGGYASMPIPLPDGTIVSSHTDLGWALAMKQGGISWYQMAMGVACAGAIALIAVLALDDETGIGVLDDGLIPVLTTFLAEHAIVLGDAIPAFALPVCAGG